MVDNREGSCLTFGLQAHVRAWGSHRGPRRPDPPRAQSGIREDLHGDHRVAMTAMALASLVGANDRGRRLA